MASIEPAPESTAERTQGNHLGKDARTRKVPSWAYVTIFPASQPIVLESSGIPFAARLWAILDRLRPLPGRATKIHMGSPHTGARGISDRFRFPEATERKLGGTPVP